MTFEVLNKQRFHVLGTGVAQKMRTILNYRLPDMVNYPQKKSATAVPTLSAKPTYIFCLAPLRPLMTLDDP